MICKAGRLESQLKQMHSGMGGMQEQRVYIHFKYSKIELHQF